MATNQAILERAARKAIERAANHKEDVGTIVLATYEDGDGEEMTRPFQWQRHDNRVEFTRLVTWAIRNNREIKLTPIALLK